MEVKDLKARLHPRLYESLSARIERLRPAQAKAVLAGVLDKKSLLVCTPTASGKTLIAELAAVSAVLEGARAVYIVPLKALAREKYNEFARHYPSVKVKLSIGDFDSAEKLEGTKLLITTSEKLDSLLRHRAAWTLGVSCAVVDEIHLLNDPGRGPTLEVLITLLRKLVPKLQIVGLSATIGNPKELAAWLGAELVVDTWRPVKLKQYVYGS